MINKETELKLAQTAISAQKKYISYLESQQAKDIQELVRYVKHKVSCHLHPLSFKHTKAKCTCGLEELLNQKIL